MAGRKRQAADGENNGRTRKQRKVVSTSARVTRGMVVDAPRKAVFNTSELLQSILLHLPARSLFAVQRVSRQFSLAIIGSPRLQDRMLYKPKVDGENERFSVSWSNAARSRLVRIPDVDGLPSNLNTLPGNPSRVLIRGTLNPLLRPQILCDGEPSRRAIHGSGASLDLPKRTELL